MIELRQGNILNAEADVLVNTVNCVGVMGRGIALQFKKAFPEMFRAYQLVCKRGALKPGTVLVHDLSRFEPPRYIINVPTKRHWKGKSLMEDIETGLDALIAKLRELDIASVAIPPLGCGLGGLDWGEVRPRIERAFQTLPKLQVFLYKPEGAPSAEEMAKEEQSPKMTEGRSLLLVLMRRYLAAVMDPTVTLLEIHKLMYFMQEAGQDLSLRFAKGTYGPYAENLRHVLSRIEGHFISGYGDAADDPETPIESKAEAVAEAEEFLKTLPGVRKRLDRAVDLIQGFETPFGMELLSTVHWVAKHEKAMTPERALELTYAWNDRKRMFKERHIRIAWNLLLEKGWITTQQNPASSNP